MKSEYGMPGDVFNDSLYSICIWINEAFKKNQNKKTTEIDFYIKKSDRLENFNLNP